MPRGKQKKPTQSELSESKIPGAFRMGTGHHRMHVMYLLDPVQSQMLADYCQRNNCTPQQAMNAMLNKFGAEMLDRLSDKIDRGEIDPKMLR